MKRIVFLTIAILAWALNMRAQTSVTEAFDTGYVYMDGNIRIKAVRSVTTTVSTETVFGPAIAIPAGIDSSQALEAVRRGQVWLNMRFAPHKNPFWFLFERPIMQYDELSYANHVFKYGLGKERTENFYGPGGFWILMFFPCVLCFLMFIQSSKDKSFEWIMLALVFVLVNFIGAGICWPYWGNSASSLQKIIPFLIANFLAVVVSVYCSKKINALRAKKRKAKKLIVASGA